MSITLGSNFSIQTTLPLDDRFTVADLTARDAIDSGRRYEGLIVYVLGEATNFQLVGGVTNSDWVELASSGGGLASGGPFNLTDGQAATDLSGETYDSTVYMAVDFMFAIARSDAITPTSLSGTFALHNKDGTWELVMGNVKGDEPTITFSISQAGGVAQLKAALTSGPGDGLLILKKVYYEF